MDFHWPDLKLCVEVDGDGHNRPRARLEDAARDLALQAAGHRIVRLAGDNLTPDAVGRLR